MADNHALPGSHHPRPSLRLAFGLTGGLLVLVVVTGVASHSLALLADGGHMLTDVVALGLAWFAIEQAKRPPNPRHTFGYHRTGILVAMTNGVSLIAIAAAIVYEAVRRLMHPEPVSGGLVIAAAAVAIAVNAFIAARLRGQRDNLNVRAAALHVTGDLAASASVVVAGVVVLASGWPYADPAASIVIAALVTWSALRIVFDTVNVLLEGTPRGVEIVAVEKAILATHVVESVHDLHVWALSPDHLAMSCHVVVPEGSVADAEHAVRAVEQAVCAQFGVAHTTIQAELCHPCAGDGYEERGHNHPHPALASTGESRASRPM